MAKHRLVTIGDSITQGVRSGAAFDGTLAWPSFLAKAMGIADTFRSPTVAAPAMGLPVNLEHLATDVLARYGSSLSWFELPRAALRVRSWMDEVEDYWEEGPGMVRGTVRAPRVPYHNLGILGFDLRDALSLTAEKCEARIPKKRQNDAVVNQVPEHAGLRVAREVLRAGGKAQTVFDKARALARGDGVEVLVVMLGSNNALQVASELTLSWSTAPKFRNIDDKGEFTLWRPEHFASEYDKVATEAARVNADYTVLSTVPKVTIAPIARGVRQKVSPGSRYYEYYTRVWIDDDEFEPRRDKHITHQDARDADQAIDEYNDTIRSIAKVRGWHVFELGEHLDAMATKRYIDDPAARHANFVPYDWPPPLDELDPVLGTKFLRSESGRRVEGGIFSLDGIHPTVIGSALIAHELSALLRSIGVPDVRRVDLGAALAADRLNTRPPDIVDSVLGIAGWIDQLADTFTSIGRLGR